MNDKVIDFNDYKLSKEEALSFFDEVGLDDFNDIDDLFPLSVLNDEDLSFLFDETQEQKPNLKLIK